MGKLIRRAGVVIQDAAYAEPEEAKILIPAVRKTIGERMALLEFRERQAVPTTPADNPFGVGGMRNMPMRNMTVVCLDL